MTHLDEGTLVAVRDGVGGAAEATAHARECTPCARALDNARGRSRQIAEALGSLDQRVDVGVAKDVVRRRLDDRRTERRAGRGWLRAPLGRAAAILLLTAGAASALPWSPVREWWAGSPAPEPSTVSSRPVTPTQSSSPPGISVDVPAGRIAVVVRGAEPGSVIDVVWMDDDAARVTAPPGSTFSYADGRVEVAVAAGPLRVELPRAASAASLEVNGFVFLERSGDRLDVTGPTEARTDGGLRFAVPAS